MSIGYYVLNNSRVVYTPGHYDEETAKMLARKWADRYPGRTYRVVALVETYKVKK